ncbi:MAG TPA: PIG-L family deacetylase, partial [Vicinamibacterales bacterium]|nr:PIG-L family deacetylase [Vicinamibacterales bacterium]
MTLDPVDLLVFGPHADDLEIGLGGTIARHTSAGHRAGLCDLTRAELSSNGTPEQRLTEAAAAATVLGAAWRENLGWPDGGIDGRAEQIHAAVELIRQARPRVVAIPYWSDRHPDH